MAYDVLLVRRRHDPSGIVGIGGQPLRGSPHLRHRVAPLRRVDARTKVLPLLVVLFIESALSIGTSGVSGPSSQLIGALVSLAWSCHDQLGVRTRSGFAAVKRRSYAVRRRRGAGSGGRH